MRYVSKVNFDSFVAVAFGTACLFAGCGPNSSSQDTGGATNDEPTATSDAPTTDDGASASSGSTPTSGADDTTAPGDTTASAETGEAHASCLGVQDALISSHPGGWYVYESCDGEYLIEHDGDTPADDLGAVLDASTLTFEAGITSFGVSSCCESALTCIGLYVHAYALSLDDLLAAIDDRFPSADGQCFGIRVVPQGLTEPRCDPATDPSCLPVPVCEGAATEPCCGQPEYDPTASRTPVADELSEGPCEHDGWCILGGAGGICRSIAVPDGPGFVGCTDEIAQAHCGCIDNECHWFVQP